MANPSARPAMHWSLERIRPSLKTFAPPGGDFDPSGAWDQTYTIVLGQVASPIPGATQGTVRLKRAPAPDGFALSVEQVARVAGGAAVRTVAELQCNADAVGALRSWDVEAVTVGPQGKPLEETRIKESGRVEGGAIVRAGAPEIQRDASAPLTCNWSLLEAVQRLPAGAGPLRFDLLDDLDAFRPHQQLSRYEPTEASFGGTTIQLSGWLQMGQGVLPTHYWLDERGRLLFATGAVRALIWRQ